MALGQRLGDRERVPQRVAFGREDRGHGPRGRGGQEVCGEGAAVEAGMPDLHGEAEPVEHKPGAQRPARKGLVPDE